MKKDLLNSKKDGLLSLEDIVIESFVTGYVNSNPTVVGILTPNNGGGGDNKNTPAPNCRIVGTNIPACNMVSDVAVTCQPNNTYYCTNEENTCPASIQGSCLCNAGVTNLPTCEGRTCQHNCTIAGDICANLGSVEQSCQCNVDVTNFQTCQGITCGNTCNNNATCWQVTCGDVATCNQGATCNLCTQHATCGNRNTCDYQVTCGRVDTCGPLCTRFETNNPTCQNNGTCHNLCTKVGTCHPFTCCATCPATCIALCNLIDTNHTCNNNTACVRTHLPHCPEGTMHDNTYIGPCNNTKIMDWCKTYPPCGPTDYHAGCATKNLDDICIATNGGGPCNPITGLPACAFIPTQPPEPGCGIMY